MKLNIHLESYTLAGSGEGAGIIDSDVVFDRFGLPYLPGRRIKGLLRESAVEVLEMLGIDNQHGLDILFGVTGNSVGVCLIPNLRLPGHDALVKHLRWMSAENGFREIVSRENLISLYTTIRQQTAIDEDGFADDGTLRVCRLLNHDLEFEGEIECKQPLAPCEEALLFLASINLARMGVRRNRGQGAIRCTLAGDWSVDQAYALLLTQETTDSLTGGTASAPQTESTAPEPAYAISRRCLPYTVRLIEPVILSTPVSDQNTISTTDYLPGTAIRGMLAWRTIDRLGIDGAVAYDHQAFHHLFLAGGLSIGPAFPTYEETVFHPTPLCLQRRKDDLHQEVYNLLKANDDGIVEKLDTAEEDTRQIGGLVAVSADDNDNEVLYRLEPAKTFHFHGSRKDARIAGRSTASQGAIFTYESLDAGQEFRGEILGSDSDLKYLKELLCTTFTANLGRSRSAQYGRVEVKFEDDQPLPNLATGMTVQITTLSPLLLRNEMGFPDVSENALCASFVAFFPNGVSIEIDKIFAAVTTFESFNSSMRIKTPIEVGFAEGSSFIVTISGISPDDFKAGITQLATVGLGERTAEGFGKVQVGGYDEGKYGVHSVDIAADDDTPFPDTLRSMIERLALADITLKARFKGSSNAGEYSDRPNNHLIGRLVAMIGGSVNLSDWMTKLAALRKTAREALGDCRWGGASLHQHLTEFTKPTEIIRENMLSGKYVSIIARADIDNAVFLSESFPIAKEYWRSLLLRMRQLNRLEEG